MADIPIVMLGFPVPFGILMAHTKGELLSLLTQSLRDLLDIPGRFMRLGATSPVSMKLSGAPLILLHFEEADVIQLELRVNSKPLLFTRFSERDHRIIDYRLEFVEILTDLERIRLENGSHETTGGFNNSSIF